MSEKWNKRFLDMAKLISTWSKDPSTIVGCVITDNLNRVISIGYNGYPRGVKDTYNDDRNEKLRKTIHAEENALLFAKQSLIGTTIYVTHPPCSRCAAKLIQAGVSTIIYLQPTNEFIKRWEDDIKSSLSMYKDVGMNVMAYIEDDINDMSSMVIN